MAENIISESNARPEAADLHFRAHLLVKEMLEEGAKIFAVAAAGHAYVREQDINAAYLFDVIREITEGVTVQQSLQDVIDGLAKLAGSNLTREQAEVHHD